MIGRCTALALSLLGLVGCSSPLGRIGLDPELIRAAQKDTAAWCIRAGMSTTGAGWISYWRDNAVDRPASTMRDCVGPVVLP